MPDVTVNGCRIWYELVGSGDYVLQIGGAGFAHENFGLVTADFAERFTVIDFDLRGYGRSERPVQDYSMDVWADDVAGLLDAIGVEKAHVHGTSMGGMVAIRLAARYPDKVDGLVIGCASAKSDFMSRARWQVWKALATAYGMGSDVLALELATQALTRSFLDSEKGPAVVETIQGVLERNCSVEIFCAACDAMLEMDLTGDLAAITAPTLVMDGDEDILTPVKQGPQGAGSDVIAALVPNAELRVLDGVAHTNLLEVPELSVAIVSEFFERVSTQAPRAAAKT
jgi:pimeloyl-ACP methyl ester carboxylesterase